ncbi:hypothetical protein GJW-30_1_00687 [Variibacter gotjawalensis]|uniref:Retroviral aspartyl protease n=2 Tax=Variibacter gotjawalensis TaxID=1333996 RepID=A0A0S3PQD5_9BRAD|nr:aspartyl protease family protein [Variibacter gotjawalensis]BAT58166.1 hypothetical protein GJW-30_1_00687 [Variibacter gotjawalensis]
MRNMIALIVVAVVAAFGATLFAQRMSTATRAPAPVQTAQPAEASGPTRLILLAGRGGHFDVGATVGDAVLNFVVDTGASFVALNYQDAQKAGVKVRAEDFKHSVSTANGVTKAAEVILPSVKIKGIKVTNVRAMVLPSGAMNGMNLLGNSFLARLKSYEVRSGQLTMEQ